MLQGVDEVAKREAVEVGLDLGVEGAGEVGDFVEGEVAGEERSGGVALELVEVFDLGAEGGEGVGEGAEVWVGGEGGVGLGFEVEESVDGGAGIGFEEEGERGGGGVEVIGSFLEGVEES